MLHLLFLFALFLRDWRDIWKKQGNGESGL